MIIFGTRGVTTTPERGSFFCPQCGGRQTFSRKRVRRFFTLYFIPVIPLDVLGEYIECDLCTGTFNDGVLRLNPEGGSEKFEAEFNRAIKRVMVLMLLADGVIEDNEIAAIRAIYTKLADADLSEADVRAEIKAAVQESSRVSTYVKTVLPRLNQPGKEMVVKAAFMVAAADGTIAPQEKALLDEIGKALELPGARMKSLIQELSADMGPTQPTAQA